jgi:hypothetical protein
MTLAAQAPTFSRAFWLLLFAGFLTVLCMGLIDGVNVMLHAEGFEATRVARGGVLFAGLTFAVIAPWRSRLPVWVRLALSLFCAVLWFAGMGVFLTFYNEWSSHHEHAGEIEQAFRQRVLPAVAFIRDFEQREHRLPSDEELEKAGWQIGTNEGGKGVRIQVDRDPSRGFANWGTVGKDFVVETSVPQWTVYYRSWDNQRIEANWE